MEPFFSEGRLRGKLRIAAWKEGGCRSELGKPGKFILDAAIVLKFALTIKNLPNLGCQLLRSERLLNEVCLFVKYPMIFNGVICIARHK